MVLVKSTHKCLYRCSGVLFNPGMNDIEKAVLDGLLTHPFFQLELGSGRIVLPLNYTSEKRDRDISYSEMGVEELVEVIGETIDLHLLNKMEKGETRKKVLKAIREQKERYFTPLSPEEIAVKEQLDAAKPKYK